MGEDELRKAFLKGYEEGLKAAWREIGLLTTRGYSSTELSVMAKSKMAVLYRDVESMAAAPSQYVLEVHAGFCAQHGIAAGDAVEFVRVPNTSE